MIIIAQCKKYIYKYMTKIFKNSWWILLLCFLIITLFYIVRLYTIQEILTTNLRDAGTIVVNGRTKIKKIEIRDGGDYLQIGELQITTESNKILKWNDFKNISNKTGIWDNNWKFHNLVDDNDRTGFHSRHGRDTLTMELLYAEFIKSITFCNRADCCRTRINGYKLYLYDESNSIVASVDLIGYNDLPLCSIYKIDYVYQGKQGIKGPQGDKGQQGIKGEQGIKGPQGIKGEQGDKGQSKIAEKGDKGERGDIGIVGIQGNLGQQGEKGPQGDKGKKGEEGEQGDIGPKGQVGSRVQIIQPFTTIDNCSNYMSSLSCPASYI